MTLIHETAGSELAKLNFSHQRSTQDIIINEDWAMVVKITTYDETTGAVTGEKVWDTATEPAVFNAFAKYNGKSGIPVASDVEIDSYAVFHRTGEFNTAITSGSPTPAIRTDGANSYSWLLLIAKVS